MKDRPGNCVLIVNGKQITGVLVKPYRVNPQWTIQTRDTLDHIIPGEKVTIVEMKWRYQCKKARSLPCCKWVAYEGTYQRSEENPEGFLSHKISDGVFCDQGVIPDIVPEEWICSRCGYN